MDLPLDFPLATEAQVRPSVPIGSFPSDTKSLIETVSKYLLEKSIQFENEVRVMIPKSGGERELRKSSDQLTSNLYSIVSGRKG